MRILFSFVGGSGHFNPLVSIARAAEATNHTVAFAGKHAMAPAVKAAGFSVFAIGAPGSGAPKRIAILALDSAREDRDLREGFADRIARERAAKILALCDEWRPDLLVWMRSILAAWLRPSGSGCRTQACWSPSR